MVPRHYNKGLRVISPPFLKVFPPNFARALEKWGGFLLDLAYSKALADGCSDMSYPGVT